MTKPTKDNRKYLASKVSARALQLARLVCAYEPDTNMSKLISDLVEPMLIKKLEKLGALIPPDPDAPKS